MNQIVGTGEMAERIRTYPWSSTELGPIETWSSLLCSYVNLILSSPSPATLSWGSDLRFFYNDAAIGTVGRQHPAALGGVYREVFHEAWHLVGPDMLACFERGESPVRENILIPLERDGRMQDFYWTYSLLPIHEGDRIVGVYDPFQNTTAMVTAVRERDAVAAQLRQVLEDTSESVSTIDWNWTVTYMNPQGLRVSAPVDPVGKNIWECYPEFQKAPSPWMEHYYRAMDERIAGTFEAFYGEPINVWVNVQVKPSADGITVFFRDVTEMKRSEAVLLQNEKLAAVGRLAASIAHEINNPLESVTNLLYLLRTSDNLTEVRRYVDIAEAELRRVSLITNQTLRFHKQATRANDTDVNNLLRECLSLYHGRLANQPFELTESFRANKLVCCFEGEIRQVLNNLIGNAIDAMPVGGRLTLRTRDAVSPRTGVEGVVITVADTGSGMSAETRKRLFEAFYTTKGLGGTGLGLWVSAEIIDRHRGRVWVRSNDSPEGPTGSVFRLFLPRSAQPEVGASG